MLGIFINGMVSRMGAFVPMMFFALHYLGMAEIFRNEVDKFGGY